MSNSNSNVTPAFFSSQSEFRKWLEKYHKLETEIIVGFYKVTSGKQNMTWSQSVDEALCFGWIDGVRKSIDNVSYCIRFTPRKKTSNWSSVNIKKVDELIKQGLMKPAGIAAFNFRKAEKSGTYSFERENSELPESFIKRFKSNKNAWDFFARQAPSYQKTMIYWICSAKQESTRISRLEKTIAESNNQKRIGDQYRGKFAGRDKP
jgi:uncharacterized protein YdeI (YjbR/CyaY-like superfamily)